MPPPPKTLAGAEDRQLDQLLTVVLVGIFCGSMEHICILTSKFVGEQMRLRLDIPADIEDGLRVAVCVILFMGLGLGLYRPLTGDFLFADILEFCSWCVAASPCCCLLAASTGTKAWLKAPSANRRRNRLGMRKATLKASVMALAPNIDAMSNSRPSPVMREARVSSDTVDTDLKRLTRPV